MIEVKSLTAGYNNIDIIKDINMIINKGEMVAILGPNGSGKTTLLRSLVGIIDAYDGYIKKGDIKRDSLSIIHNKPYELFRSGIAFVPDGGKVFSGMTVHENLEMGGYTMEDRGVLAARIENVLRTFPILEPLLKRIAGSLSGGERQILSLARSLITEPEFLILDEPTAGLSPNYMKILFKKLVALKKDIGVLIVEQNARLALQYVDRGYVMRNGKFAFAGSAEKLLKEEDVFKLL